ncbi:MAG: type II secretion system protein [Phycisphaeraceae bacterium]|nr:type II secretion system protein [Phycisphaeraceae bacterium]
MRGRSWSACAPAPGTIRGSGFTLIELLVVIGISGVVMGLTLSAVAHCRGQAHAVRCLNNLRQIGQVVMAYANDHDQHLPMVEEPIWQKGGQIQWDADPRDRESSPNSFLNVMADYLNDPAVLVCPSAVLGYPRRQFAVTYRLSAANNRNGVAATVDQLVMNSGAVQYDYSLKYFNGRPYELKHVDGGQLPPRLADGAGPYYLARDFLERTPDGKFIKPHEEGFNQLFLDMHVERLTSGESLTYP